MSIVRKCKGCGNNLAYDAATQKLYCEHCRNYYEFKQPNWNKIKKDLNLKFKEKVYDKLYVCPNCGNKEKFNPSSIAFECSYCNTPIVIPAFKNDIDAISPFKITEEQALSSYKDWIAKKIWAPRKLKKLAKVGKFVGHYMPAWAFDATAKSNFSGQEAIQRPVIRRDTQGRTYTVIETFYRPFSGTRTDRFDNVITAGNNFISNDTLEKLEPFDYYNLKVYRDEYLFGYLLENYSIDVNSGYNTAKQEMATNIRQRIYANSTKKIVSLNVSTEYFNQKQARYLLPIWRSEFKYNKKNYDFYINGCSGKVVGKTPISILKVLLAVIFGIAIAGLIIYLIMRG